MPARASTSSPASRFSSVAVAAQRDHVRVLQQQQLVGDQPLLALGHELLLQLERLAVVHAPEFAQLQQLRIDGQTVDGVEGLAHGFVERGMRVDGLHHHLDGGLRFHGGHGFGDQLEGLRADDVDAQNLAVASRRPPL